MNEHCNNLRTLYPTMEYAAWHWVDEVDGLRIWFDFKMGAVEFHPTALVERRPFLDAHLPDDLIDRLVFDIGMVELVSYWKCACPPIVNISCASLSDNQLAFWRKLYWNGLGEFFYTNHIDHLSPDATTDPSREPFMTIHCSGPALPQATIQATSQGYLVPIGGGKDSVVTLELLRHAGASVRPMIMNPRGATTACAAVAGFPLDQVVVVRRQIDPQLLALNQQGYLNGHTPFSAMLAFYTRLCAAMSGLSNIALSNENSANEPTVVSTADSRWANVNHQYSKSLEFENDFRAYVGPSVNYFSFLRPLTELQIAMLFSRMQAYHDVFRSCNVGSKTDIWCGHCAKCLFAYLILLPFLPPQRLNAIFGRPMLDDVSLRPLLLQLLGLEATKPFECVGTVSEVRQAISMAIARWYTNAIPPLLQHLPSLPLSTTSSIDLNHIAHEGNLSSAEQIILQQACSVNNL